MKNLFNLSIAFLLAFNFQAAASTKNFKDDSLNCLLIKGKIANAFTLDENECKVELISSKGVIESTILRSGKCKFQFVLKRNTYYAIRITKDGFVTRIVSVNTEFPSEIHDLCMFSFNTELISEQESELLNRDALDFPIAIVHFDPETESFIHNRNYTADIKREIQSPDNSQFRSSSKSIASVEID